MQNNINVSKFSIGIYIVKLKSEFNGNKTQNLIINYMDNKSRL